MSLLREAVEKRKQYYLTELSKAGVLIQTEKELTLSELVQEYQKLKVNLKISQYY